MRDFVFAALPLAAVGVALAVAATIAQRKEAKDEQSEDANGDKKN